MPQSDVRCRRMPEIAAVCRRGSLPRGIFTWGDLVTGGSCHGGILAGGSPPGGCCSLTGHTIFLYEKLILTSPKILLFHFYFIPPDVVSFFLCWNNHHSERSDSQCQVIKCNLIKRMAPTLGIGALKRVLTKPVQFSGFAPGKKIPVTWGNFGHISVSLNPDFP